MSSSSKPEEQLQHIVDYEGEKEKFPQWFMRQFQEIPPNGCSLEDFTVYFLNSLRQHTEQHLKVNSTAAGGGSDTPKCQTPIKTPKPATNQTHDDSLAVRFLTSHNAAASTPNQSTRNEISQTSFGDWTNNHHSVPRLSTSVDRSNISHKNLTSTPVKRNTSGGNSRRLSTTPGSTNKSASTSLCLGDFLVVSTPTSHNRSNKKKNTSGTNVTQHSVGGGGGTASAADKPKKRVQPISISKKVDKSSANNSVFAGESSFSNENNILKISHTEVEDKDQCAIMAARKTLKSNASEITKELAPQLVTTNLPLTSSTSLVLAASTPTKTKNPLTIIDDDMPPLDFEDMVGNKLLHRLADIYVILITNHLTTNFLNDLSFLLNLLNAAPAACISSNTVADAFKKLELQDIDDAARTSKILRCLENLKYAIYFALQCLCQLKERLANLDSKTLKVVLTNERFSYFPEDMRNYLLDIYQKKQQIIADNPMHDASFCLDSKTTTGQNNVYFQQEQDTRHNFSSHQEFANFRPQRDLFCKCLKLWEANHLNPNWKFAIEIKPIIREIFQQSENCVNMAHFAKLFVSQLLLSASSAATPEEIGLEVDLQKFSKLTQRLIAPSQFSVDYQFPRAQAFFRDFILNARSLPFAEQLKMELYSELLSLNDSTFDHVNINKTEADNNDNSLIADMAQHEQVAVRPEILNAMLILAKFLGFTISLPYSNCGIIPPSMEKKQIRLRSLLQPSFDLHNVLKDGVEKGKLLITIPWMVQYLCMLDNITLQLEVHIRALKLMFALYWYLGDPAAADSSILNRTSCFIIASCLGWLFDSQQYLIEQYYQFRSDPIENREFLEYLKSKLQNNQEDCQEICSSSQQDTADGGLNHLLESLLPVACPFLGEFRVSIMPAKYAQTKYASRTGRYRHITTRLAELSPAAVTAKDDDKPTAGGSLLDTSRTTQKNLMQAFIQSQNSSTRQMLGFCGERAYKCVVKDGQLKILLPAKSKADQEVNEINSCDYNTVFNKIKHIYSSARHTAIGKWNEDIPKMLDKRIKNSLESLLPEETPDILKKTYFMIIKKDAEKRISQWFYGNILRDNYFCVELPTMANKLCSANKTKQPSELKILNEVPSVSELIDNLQYWLHCTSLRVELFKDSKPIVDLMHNIRQSFDNVLPTILYRLMATNIIQLLQHIITANCKHLSDELIDASCKIFLHPNMRKALEMSAKHTTEEQSSQRPLGIYDGLVTIAFLQSLALRTECYTAFGNLIISMIKQQIITMSYTNSLFVNIFKYDWHPQQLNEISNMLRTIAKNTTDVPTNTSCSRDSDNDDDNGEEEEDDEKSNLFMDMLADLSRDIDLY
ncbi:protein disks lost [Musca vetustissima]|uniref:protein disks lost n=1 Tax=Musca vetustissima TaxID=27455 RepID=UPI002AB724EC|nr:protein disks lost [Musca vetustissima]